MSDIRINALATTATASASDDYVAIDGSANGTRKLSAYSPTFGGNLTVSGTIYPSGASATLTASVANTIISSNGATRLQIDHGNGGWGRLQIIPQQTRADISSVLNNATTAQTLGLVGSSVEILTSGGTLAATFNSSQNTTLAGNLTVSGGTITSGSGTLTLNSSANTVVLQSAGTTALTLDSSQNATFAKGATINSGAADTRALRLTENGTRTLDFTLTSANTADISANTALRLNSSGTLAVTLDSSQRCILAGALRLNNAYVAGAPTATGYVTIQDSAGTTYKVLVST